MKRYIQMLACVIPVAVAGSLVLAQEPVERPQQEAAQTAPAAPAPKPAAKPELSPLEAARIDVLAVTRQRDQALELLGQCQAALSPLQTRERDNRLGAQIQAMRQMIEASHPGMTWDVTKGQLVPKPAAASSPAPSPAPPKKE